MGKKRSGEEEEFRSIGLGLDCAKRSKYLAYTSGWLTMMMAEETWGVKRYYRVLFQITKSGRIGVGSH